MTLSRRETSPESLERFLQVRRESVIWLRGLEKPRWENGYDHPKLGLIHAGDMLASWLAHDLLHMRQLVHLQFDELNARIKPCSTAYAGAW